MTTMPVTSQPVTGQPETSPNATGHDFDVDALSTKARDHLWMHFTRQSSYADSPVPTA